MVGTNPTDDRVVNVGIIGCSKALQAGYIPTLNLLPRLFKITYLYDISDRAIRFCQSRVAGGGGGGGTSSSASSSPSPKITRNAEELCTSPEVDLVMICTIDCFHVSLTISALKAGKYVFIDKPISLNLRDIDMIIDADGDVGGNKVFVGNMRRYSSAFRDAVRQVGNMESIRYVRVRDIVGPKSVYLKQPGRAPPALVDAREVEDLNLLRKKKDEDIEQALERELGVEVTEETKMMWNLLSILGCHDLSAMRETFGMPTGVVGFAPCRAVESPFWSAIFQYPHFAVAYESGIDQVARFDASIEIFGDKKTVKVCIDAPFVKGLPTTMVVKAGYLDRTCTESIIRRTCEDPYTLELEEIHEWVVDWIVPKTSPADARKDLEILGMLMKSIAKPVVIS